METNEAPGTTKTLYRSTWNRFQVNSPKSPLSHARWTGRDPQQTNRRWSRTEEKHLYISRASLRQLKLPDQHSLLGSLIDGFLPNLGPRTGDRLCWPFQPLLLEPGSLNFGYPPPASICELLLQLNTDGSRAPPSA